MRARLLLGDTPYIISSAGKQGSTMADGTLAADTSTTQGVSLALADNGDDRFRWGFRDTQDLTEFTVVIVVDGEGSVTDFLTRYAVVKALLDARFTSLRLQADTGVDLIDGRLSAGKFSTWECEYETVGAVFGGGAAIVATFRGNKAILSAGTGSAGTAENPTGLEDQITYTIVQDERGISGVYARALVHGTAGSAYTSSAGAKARLQAWFDLIKASPPSFVPTFAKFVPGSVQVGSKNEEATGDCQWITSSDQSGIASMSAAIKVATWEVSKTPRRLDERAGALPGLDVEIVVKLVYQADNNENVFSATAATAVADSTIATDIDLAISRALSENGIGEVFYTQPIGVARASSGSEVVARAVGITTPSGVLAYEATTVYNKVYTGEIVTVADGTDIPQGLPDPYVWTCTVEYDVSYFAGAGGALTPTMPGGYFLLSETPPVETATTTDAGIKIIRRRGSSTGRRMRGNGAAPAAPDGGIGQALSDIEAQLASVFRGL